MAGATVATWVKVKTKSGFTSRPISHKYEGGAGYEPGQVITQSEYQKLKAEGNQKREDGKTGGSEKAITEKIATLKLQEKEALAAISGRSSYSASDADYQQNEIDRASETVRKQKELYQKAEKEFLEEAQKSDPDRSILSKRFEKMNKESWSLATEMGMLEQLNLSRAGNREFKESSFYPQTKKPSKKELADAYDAFSREKQANIIKKRFKEAEDLLQGKPSLNREKIKQDEVFFNAIANKKVSPEQISAFQKAAKKILDDPDTQIFVSVAQDSLDAILKDGLKNAFSAEKKSTGYKQSRRLAERSNQGIGLVPDSVRPISGYVASRKDLWDQKATKTTDGDYGGANSVKIELADAKGRSTITGGDSFNEPIAARRFNDPHPSQFYSPFDQSTDLKGRISSPPKTVDDLTGNNLYVEAQVYGGVSPRQIKALHFRSTPDSRILEMARKQGIPVVVNGKAQ